TFDGGDGAGAHALSIANVSFAKMGYKASGAHSGAFTLDGQIITVDRVNQSNIATQLAFVTGRQTLMPSQISAPITVERRDPFGNGVTAGFGGVALTVGTDSGGGTLLDTNGQPLGGNTVTIVQGASSASFKYQDVTLGSPTLTVSGTNLGSAIQQETIKQP